MNKKKVLRSVLAVTILILTITVFTIYLVRHPEVLHTLGRVSPLTLATIFGLYCLFIGTLILIQRATLQLCNIRLSGKESSLLMMYSAIINFFGPLQSGPGFRAAYLKKKHNISLKKYTLATLVYYGLYALFSALQIAAFIFGWWIAALTILAFLAAPLALRIPRFKNLQLRAVFHLSAATFAQVMVQSAIYFVALQSILPQVSYLKTLIYTGAANFALFVSITPGAIGFRESFLLFTQGLHEFGVSTIAAASVIDRSIYILLLLVMAAFIFGIHADNYFKISDKIVKIKKEV